MPPISPTPTLTSSKRALAPAALAVLVWLVAWLAYNLGPALPGPIHRPLATGAGVLMFLAIGLSGLAVWPLARLRGARIAAAGLASEAVAITWIFKEIVRLTASFTVLEALFYAVSPLALTALLANLACMGLGELIARLIRRRRGEPISVLSLPPVAVVLAALIAIGLLFGRTLGEQAVYSWLAVFRAIFGPGVGV